VWNRRKRWLAPLLLAAIGLGLLPGDGQSRPRRPPPAPSFRTGDPILATTYFYWYDVDPDHPGARFTTHPTSWEDFTWRSVPWHKRQLVDMESAGIDVVLPDYWGNPGIPDQPNHPSYSVYGGIRTLVAAREELLREGRKPPGIGMFYDTNSLIANSLDADFDPSNPGVIQDLTTEEGKDWFYQTISGFFALVPEEHRALIDGKPIVFLYLLSNARDVDQGLFPYVQRRFERDFGTRLFLVKDRQELTAIFTSDAILGVWVEKIRRGELTEAKALAQILASDEFYRRSGGTPGGFAEGLARAVLGSRPAPVPPAAELETPAGRLARVDALLAGPTREEYHRRLVADLYKLLLDRPEPLDLLVLNMATGEFVDRGMFEAVRALNDGVSPNDVRATILASPAFLEQSGQTTEGFVRRLYETLLCRGPAPSEVDRWSGMINQQLANQGLPDLAAAPRVRQDIAAQFLTTPEAVTNVVARWYAQYLGRRPGWSGYADSVYNWGGSITPEFFEVASIGPGFEVNAPVRFKKDRQGGGFYRQSWETILAMHPRPSIVHIETWNEYYEATNIAECREYGRQYLEMTRDYAAQFHAR
jgi:hypothetical protein